MAWHIAWLKDSVLESSSCTIRKNMFLPIISSCSNLTRCQCERKLCRFALKMKEGIWMRRRALLPVVTGQVARKSSRPKPYRWTRVMLPEIHSHVARNPRSCRPQFYWVKKSNILSKSQGINSVNLQCKAFENTSARFQASPQIFLRT